MYVSYSVLFALLHRLNQHVRFIFIIHFTMFLTSFDERKEDENYTELIQIYNDYTSIKVYIRQEIHLYKFPAR